MASESTIKGSTTPRLVSACPEEDSRIEVPDHVDTWDEYFMWMAVAASIKSKDPRCRVGAVIASADHLILSTGFNGLARGVYDNDQILSNPEEKLRVVCHAEQNAIINAARCGVSLKDAHIFVTKFPCLMCCNNIIQAGITRIYTHDKSFWNDDPLDQDHERKKRILKEAGIVVNAPYHPAFQPREQITPKKPPSREPSTRTRRQTKSTTAVNQARLPIE